MLNKTDKLLSVGVFVKYEDEDGDSQSVTKWYTNVEDAIMRLQSILESQPKKSGGFDLDKEIVQK